MTSVQYTYNLKEKESIIVFNKLTVKQISLPNYFSVIILTYILVSALTHWKPSLTSAMV